MAVALAGAYAPPFREVEVVVSPQLGVCRRACPVGSPSRQRMYWRGGLNAPCALEQTAPPPLATAVIRS
jgi:hypothetical protein